MIDGAGNHIKQVRLPGLCAARVGHCDPVVLPNLRDRDISLPFAIRKIIADSGIDGGCQIRNIYGSGKLACYVGIRIQCSHINLKWLAGCLGANRGNLKTG